MKQVFNLNTRRSGNNFTEIAVPGQQYQDMEVKVVSSDLLIMVQFWATILKMNF